jgi:phosphoadenosine phosphosulfate reductase
MIHIISKYASEIPVYFVNTGYHFAETIAFRDKIATDFNLHLRIVKSPIEKIQQRDAEGKLMFVCDPDYCCYLNKILPLEPVLHEHDVWINGIRRDQTEFRKSLKRIEKGAFETQRYHPMLEWDSEMIRIYRQVFQLPGHPLEEDGYVSIGCMPCSSPAITTEDERDGRWKGLQKTECGIHTELIKK